MESEKWIEVDTEFGRLSGEMIRILFESRGIPVYLAQEGAGAAYGFTIGRLGNVSVFVPESRVEEARNLLTDVREGRLEGVEEGEPENPHDEKGETLDPDAEN